MLPSTSHFERSSEGTKNRGDKPSDPSVTMGRASRRREQRVAGADCVDDTVGKSCPTTKKER